MTSHDAALWKGAKTLRDIGALTARWLEGDIASQPGYMPNCGPDDETEPLIPVLAMLNRAGVYTLASQPGLPDTADSEGSVWCQRAAMDGFIEPGHVEMLRQAAQDAGLMMALSREATERWGIEATTVDKVGYTWFGRWLAPGDIDFYFDDLSVAGLATVQAAEQFALVDPQWGRVDSPLWPMLERFAEWLEASR